MKLCSASGILTPPMALPLLKQLLILTMVSSHDQQPLHRRFSLPCSCKEAFTDWPGFPPYRHGPRFPVLCQVHACAPWRPKLSPATLPRKENSFWDAYCSSTTTGKSPLRRFHHLITPYFPFSSPSPPWPFYLITASYSLKLSPYATRSFLNSARLPSLDTGLHSLRACGRKTALACSQMASNLTSIHRVFYYLLLQKAASTRQFKAP